VQVLLNNGAGGLNAAMAANKKQREVYVGNLVIGSITELMLRELFNAALAHFVAGVTPAGFKFVALRLYFCGSTLAV
jgi:hypothetical protein